MKRVTTELSVYLLGVEREKQNLEKQMADLRVQLNFSAMASELEEVKRCMDRKDLEKANLAAKIEVTAAFNLHLKHSCNFIY